jgi:tRNA uridine 5-carbamoylmethylation protein Kti12
MIMKLAIIMHGISGSGKSTTTNKFIEKYSKKYGGNFTSSTHSTDNYFMDNGEYQFDSSKLVEYHELNHKEFCNSLDRNINLVIVDNTNILPEHWEPYVVAAKSKEYRVQHFWLPIIDAEVAFERNLHNVPIHAIERQIENYKEYYPN